MEEIQPVSSEDNLSPEEAKAVLGLVTRISEQQMMAQAEQAQMMGGTGGGEAQQEPTDAPMSPQEPQGEEQAPEVTQEPSEPQPLDLEPIKEGLIKELAPVIKDAIKEEMGGIRKEIEKALEDEDEKVKKTKAK